jgi:ankyrin repeat protein
MSNTFTFNNNDNLLVSYCETYDQRDPRDFFCIRRLLLKDANPNSRSIYGDSALKIAVEHGCIEAVKILIKFGADVNYQNPLMDACRNRKWRIVKILLDAGANPNQITRCTNPLSYAATYDQIKIVKLLLAHNANVDIEDGCPLKRAAFNGNTELVALLLKSGAKVDIELDFVGSALYLAASNGRTKCVRLLLEAGANANARSRDHETALHMAALSGFYDIVHLLLKAGANMYNVDKQGIMPLIYAREQSYNLNLLPRPLLKCRRAYRCLGTYVVIDAILALASMNVSPYVMTWILQWTYNLPDCDQLWVLRVIEGVQNSRARIVATKFDGDFIQEEAT